MNCCPNCFRDREIIAFIQTNSTQKGDCEFCACQNMEIIPASELIDIFQDLFNAYSVVPDDDDKLNGKLLFLNFKGWNIFGLNLDDNKIEKLIKEIGKKVSGDLLTKKTVPTVFLNLQNQEEAEHYDITWNQFKEEIKNTNRFFLQNQFELEKVKQILKSYERTYKKDKLFYRARNSDSKGLGPDAMGRPPSNTATPGRANPRGISYLYLANDLKTTLYEVRAAIYDYVTVGTFMLLDEIKIVSLRHNERLSPFQLEDIDKYLLYERFVQSLHYDLKKPLRRQDSEIEYLPTQYLCELIKSLGYDGVEYGSSMNPDGFNIALFSDDKLQCVDCELYEITSISYKFDKVKLSP